ncbi:hypothetical protein ABT317_10830 [Streptomyces carpinensis]|uniref:Uncharacterized protein n=1 Tax=Streptomyces carpinensis TaxID=66369 RepID=A0ABV1VZX3_9ACTN
MLQDRDTLRAACPGVFFLHLKADHELLVERIDHSTGHFTPKLLRGLPSTPHARDRSRDTERLRRSWQGGVAGFAYSTVRR